MSVRAHEIPAHDGIRHRAKVRQEDAAARRGRAQGRTVRRSEDRFPTSGFVASALLYVEVVSQRFVFSVLEESSASYASEGTERSKDRLDARELPITSRMFLMTADR